MAGYATLYREVVASYRGTRREESERTVAAARWFFRPLSFAATPPLLRLGLSANAVTAANFLCLIAALALLLVDYDFRFLSAALIVLAGVLDYADGNVARYRKTFTIFGKFVDGLVDGVFFLHIFVLGWSVGLAQYGLSEAALLVILVAALGTFASIYEHILLLRYAAFRHEQTAAAPPASDIDVGAPAGSSPGPIRLFATNWGLSLPLLAAVALVLDLTLPYVFLCAAVSAVLFAARAVVTIRRARENLSAADKRSMQAS